MPTKSVHTRGLFIHTPDAPLSRQLLCHKHCRPQVADELEESFRLVHVSRHCQQLQSLVLDGEAALRAPADMAKMTGLETLELKDVHFQAGSCIGHVVQACPVLRHLALEYVHSSAELVVDSCPFLETLSFECITGCQSITVHAPLLKELLVQENDSSDTGIQLSSVTLIEGSNLRRLALRLNTAVAVAIPVQPHLMQLLAHGIPWCSIQPLIQGSLGNLQLLEFGVAGWHDANTWEDNSFSGDGLEFLAKHTPKLEELMLGTGVGNRIRTLAAQAQAAGRPAITAGLGWPALWHLRLHMSGTPGDLFLQLLEDVLLVAPALDTLCIGSMKRFFTSSQSDYMRQSAEVKFFNGVLALQRRYPKVRVNLE